ncbi:MAG: DNA/pantothenate metabolism flavoprotein domain protein [Verrucomicrobiales bacterium]|nr:DNA/pantothenate metabolism flavoprotein domain protein [Verrucomicrobiales bacterium]
MRILITCGPAYEPIDGARRLTNLSTGRLGIALANHLARKGHDVVCLKGEGATDPTPLLAHSCGTFTTNDDLALRISQLAALQDFDAVYHAAALCDFRVAETLDDAGAPVRSAKIATRNGRLTLVLEPATKIIAKLRSWFPRALIVGWKFELAGGRDDALDRAWHQIDRNHTDACVLNGAAYGPGFAVCERSGRIRECPDIGSLCLELNDHLLLWSGRRATTPLPSRPVHLAA